LNIPVTVSEDPLTAIARGAGVILEDLDKYRNVLLESEDDAYSNK
jgi:actin-like ATPase involved in cell morphogenesis